MRLTTLLFVALLMAACNTRPSENDNTASVDNSHDDPVEYKRCTYDEVADKAKLMERITGDFNGDGADDIGYFQWGGYSSCGTYIVFSLCDGEWRVRVVLSHNAGWNEEPYDALVRKDPSAEGYVIVREIDVEDDCIWDKRVKLL